MAAGLHQVADLRLDEVDVTCFIRPHPPPTLVGRGSGVVLVHQATIFFNHSTSHLSPFILHFHHFFTFCTLPF